jgi:Response regulator containing CheY-like receiver domain and AraC-type DNA-binding domain
MYKLIIADDEARIRRGLKNSINWNQLNIEIIGEAEDGEIALNLAKEKMPNIMLVDICMPFVNGLELIKLLKGINENCIIIIITGFDEFEYIHEALKLKVFDYILKPVNRENLKETILKAVNELNKIEEKKDYLEWANKQLDDNLSALKTSFFSKWLNGSLQYEDVVKELSFFNIRLGKNIGMIGIRVIERLNLDVYSNNWDRELINFAITNIVGDLLGNPESIVSFVDEENNIIIISNIENIEEWFKIGSELGDKVNSYIHFNVSIEQKKILNDILGVENVYKDIIHDINKKRNYKPVVHLAIKYIDGNYFLNHLSLDSVSENLNLSPSYLSKLLKQETGLSFIDYLTSVRIKRAIDIMSDPTVKIYQIAELVGYNNQHYFCKAFKKITGFSPKEYRGGK